MTASSNPMEVLLSKLDELKEQLDDLYEGQEEIKDHLKALEHALDTLSDPVEEEGGWA